MASMVLKVTCVSNKIIYITGQKCNNVTLTLFEGNLSYAYVFDRFLYAYST